MERLVPLTKILMTLAVSVWAIFLRDWMSLMALVVVELVALLLTGLLWKQYKAVFALIVFAVFLGVVQYLGSGDVVSAVVSGLRIYCTLGNDEVTRFNSSARNTMQNSL